MSDTPETDKKAHDAMRQFAGHSIGVTEAFEAVDASFARDLERKLNRANALLIEMKSAIKFAKFEAKERLHRLDQAASERTSWLESCEKMKRERDEARAERDEWIARFRADEQLIKEAMEKHE